MADPGQSAGEAGPGQAATGVTTIARIFPARNREPRPCLERRDAFLQAVAAELDGRELGPGISIVSAPAGQRTPVGTNEHLTFLTTARGAPVNERQFNRWFRAVVLAAGLSGSCVPHGLCKACAQCRGICRATYPATWPHAPSSPKRSHRR